jgi:hypothetical protein
VSRRTLMMVVPWKGSMGIVGSGEGAPG